MQHLLARVTLLGCFTAAAVAQTIVLPQLAAGAEGNSSTPYPFSIGIVPNGCVRVQNLYAAADFTTQGVTQPILINQLSFRANAFAVGGGSTFPNVEVKLSTATPFAVLGPNATFANNHGIDVTTVYPAGPVTLTPVAGGSPNGYLCTIVFTTPFLYVPAWGDLCIDVSNQNGTGIAGLQADLATNAGASGARIWDTTPGATVMSAATGQSQPGVATVVRLGYSPAPGTLATNAVAGVGCGKQFTSFHETFPTAAAFDLSNTAMTMTPLGSGNYAVTAGGAFLPVGTMGTPQPQTLADDASVTVPLSLLTVPTSTGLATSLTICSNGWVSPGTGVTTVAAGTAALLLNAAQTLWACWHDYDPTAGGTVQFEESAAMAVVTWDNVRNWGGTGPADDSTWQIQLHANGTIVFAWQTMAATGNNYVVGYSPGGTSLDPGSIDLSTALAGGGIVTAPADARPLALSATTRPVIGTSWNLTLDEVPPTAFLGVDILGLTNPNIPDLGFLGLPGCGLYSSLDLVTVFVPSGTSRPFGLALPNNPQFVGVHLFLSSAVFTTPPLNAFGAITSNAIDGTCGDL